MYDWCIGSPTAVDSLTAMFCKILDDHFLTQTNPHITRPSAISASSGNTLDLVLTNHESLIEGTTMYRIALTLIIFLLGLELREHFTVLKTVRDQFINMLKPTLMV